MERIPRRDREPAQQGQTEQGSILSTLERD